MFGNPNLQLFWLSGNAFYMHAVVSARICAGQNVFSFFTSAAPVPGGFLEF